MANSLIIGVVLFGLGSVLLFLGLPKKGVSPKFLQFHQMPMVFPPVVIFLLVMGAAEIISAFSGSH